jgi:hypothetical protein
MLVRFRSRLFRFKRFVRRHERWFTFVGAFIVIMTFVAKEGLGERWKQRADSINMAEYIYALEQDTTTLVNKTEEIRAVVRSIRFGPTPKPFHATDFDSMQKELFNSGDLISDDEVRLGNMSILSSALPEHNDDHQMAAGCRKDLDEMEKRLTSIGKQLVIREGFPQNRDGQDRYWHDLVETLRPQYSEFKVAYGQLTLKLNSLEQRIFADAESQRHKYDEYSDLAWWISAGLFVLGWSLGLLGKLYGMPEAAGNE